MRVRAQTRRPAVLAWLLAAVLPLGLVGPAEGHDVHITHALFGVHDSTLLAPGAVHDGSVRLWDVGVEWSDIETRRGVYDWTRLDQLVTAAQAAHEQVTMVVAMTPSFYASSQTLPPHRLVRYKDFVKALMKRYRSFHGSRGIDAYEVWNEANIKTFWSGTMHGMAELSRAMFQVRNRYDPRAKVIAPPMVTGRQYLLAWLKKFYAERIGGKPVWRYYDAMALSLYPFARADGSTGTPEDSMRQLADVRVRWHNDHVPASKPLWATEINYGLQSGTLLGHHAFRISAARQASFVARTYLLSAAHGIKRVFWYRYDMGDLPDGGTIGNTRLSRPKDPSHVTPAGRAYRRVQHWMHGSLESRPGHRPCATDRNGTYLCVFTDAAGTRRVYWNPSHQATVRLASGAHHLQGVLGGTRSVKPGSRLTVGYRPVMVSH